MLLSTEKPLSEHRGHGGFEGYEVSSSLYVFLVATVLVLGESNGSRMAGSGGGDEWPHSRRRSAARRIAHLSSDVSSKLVASTLH